MPLSAHLRSRRPVALVGGTASGKSAVAMAAALATPGLELISVDAMQVYRRMDIGTAKPSARDQDLVRHHCIDLVDPADEFTLADFQRHAASSESDIAGRGGHALFVGGTGLYHRAVIDRLEIPGSFPEHRVALEHEAAQGLAPLVAELRMVDPVAAARIEPTNERRLIRALEVCRGAGRPFSSFGDGLDVYPAAADSRVRQIGLRWTRDALAARIEHRVAAMMQAGLLAEVEALAAQPMGRTARQAIGYKELLAHLEGRCTLADAVAAIVTATRQFSVRQEKWFRRDPRIRWIDIDGDPLVAVPHVMEALGQ